MAQNVLINGVTYNSVSSLSIPKSGGGSAVFPDTSDADAAAGDIASGKTAYVGGSKVTGTATGGGGTTVYTITSADAGTWAAPSVGAPGDYITFRFLMMGYTNLTVTAGGQNIAYNYDASDGAQQWISFTMPSANVTITTTVKSGGGY